MLFSTIFLSVTFECRNTEYRNQRLANRYTFESYLPRILERKCQFYFKQLLKSNNRRHTINPLEWTKIQKTYVFMKVLLLAKVNKVLSQKSPRKNRVYFLQKHVTIVILLVQEGHCNLRIPNHLTMKTAFHYLPWVMLHAPKLQMRKMNQDTAQLNWRVHVQVTTAASLEKTLQLCRLEFHWSVTQGFLSL